MKLRDQIAEKIQETHERKLTDEYKFKFVDEILALIEQELPKSYSKEQLLENMPDKTDSIDDMVLKHGGINKMTGFNNCCDLMRLRLKGER